MSEGFRDAAILFDNFIDSSWSMIYVRSGELELYASRTLEIPNPMHCMMDELNVPDTPETLKVVSPQLGTVHIETATGNHVQADSTIGWLEVLDERRPILAGHAGTVAVIMVQDGSLVEFGNPLISLI